MTFSKSHNIKIMRFHLNINLLHNIKIFSNTVVDFAHFNLILADISFIY